MNCSAETWVTREVRTADKQRNCLIATLFDAVHRGRDIPPLKKEKVNDLHRLHYHAQATETDSRRRNTDNDPLSMTSS